MLICGVLAYFGHRGRATVIGVDLGTTYSVVAVRAKSGGIGAVEVVPDYVWFSDGSAARRSESYIVPSVVHFKEGSKVPVVGREAKDAIPSDPFRVVYNAKRFIGRSWEDPAVSSQSKVLSFGVARNPDESASSGVQFQLPSSNPGIYPPLLVTPEHVGTLVVSRLLKNAAKYLGHSAVQSAVVAVPAKFTTAQRVATGLAFKAAGLKVTRMLDEPTAAALAYGLHKKNNVKHILVYDFGGGTLDVSVLYVSKGFVDVVATDGDDELGGADFDVAIAEHLIKKHEMEMNATLNDKAVIRFPDFMDSVAKAKIPPCTRASMFPIAEELKIALSSQPVATAKCLTLGDSRIVSVDRKESTKFGTTEVALTLTAAEFHDIAASLLDRSTLPIRRVLAAMEIQPEEIDEVVMVGGTSRMPIIRERVKQELKKETLNTHIDPDVTVAVGCASVID